MKAIIPLLLFLPLALQAQVYRCETPDGLVYSQIPCEENAEEGDNRRYKDADRR